MRYMGWRIVNYIHVIAMNKLRVILKALARRIP
jgi:hypothetical protein